MRRAWNKAWRRSNRNPALRRPLALDWGQPLSWGAQ